VVVVAREVGTPLSLCRSVVVTGFVVGKSWLASSPGVNSSASSACALSDMLSSCSSACYASKLAQDEGGDEGEQGGQRAQTVPVHTAVNSKCHSSGQGCGPLWLASSQKVNRSACAMLSSCSSAASVST
jgi:hypothetical protein